VVSPLIPPPTTIKLPLAGVALSCVMLSLRALRFHSPKKKLRLLINAGFRRHPLSEPCNEKLEATKAAPVLGFKFQSAGYRPKTDRVNLNKNLQVSWDTWRQLFIDSTLQPAFD
jgi:hypothetical protein